MRITSSYYPLLDATVLRLHTPAAGAAASQPGAPRSKSLWQPMACPACGNRLRVPADAIGRVGRCRACASEFLIPAEERVF